MSDYFKDRPCAVCGRRDCVHKQNDRERDPAEFVVVGCNRCHGTGYVNVPSAVVKYDMPSRNDPCICGSNKKFKHCCIDMLQQQVAPTQHPCSCTYKAYVVYMAERVKLPCSVCGQKGYCKHRPDPNSEVARKMQVALADRMGKKADKKEAGALRDKIAVALRRGTEKAVSAGTRKLLQDDTGDKNA